MITSDGSTIRSCITASTRCIASNLAGGQLAPSRNLTAGESFTSGLESVAKEAERSGTSSMARPMLESLAEKGVNPVAHGWMGR